MPRELVYVTEKGLEARIDEEALTTIVQELLCEGKLTLVRIEEKESNDE